MSLLLASALIIATSSVPRLHLRLPPESCVIRSALEPTLNARLPEVSIAPDDAMEKGDRLVVIAASDAGFHLEVQDAGGKQLLARELPPDCATVPELAAAVLDRHFAEVSWHREAPELSLPAEPPPVITLPPPPVPWSIAVLAGAGFAPLQAPVGFSVEAWARRRWLQFGAQATAGLRDGVDVIVETRTRGEIQSQTFSGALFAAGCWEARARTFVCGGPMFGAVIVSANAAGELYQRSPQTFVRAAPGASASVDFAVSGRLLLGLRASALVPLSPVRLFIEGSNTEKVHSVQGLAAVAVGWSFL